ncbi:hypothetical protein Tco_0273901 [Tanacetum coccineum]
MCNTAKEIWKTLLIIHQGKSQVKDKNIDLLVQQYKQFVISEDESTDSVFARFNTIITSLKALNEGYSSKNYVRKFLCALHPKGRAKSKAERRFLALKGKKESGDEECLTSKSEDEEYVMAVRDFKKFFKRRGRCGDPNHLIRECPKPPKDKNRRAFVGGSWNDIGEEDDEKAKDKTCLVAQASSELVSTTSTSVSTGSRVSTVSISLDLSRLATTLNRLERSIQIGINKWYQSLLRNSESLPPSWSQVSLVMRTKPGVDNLSFDDLYNNLRVFESGVKGSTGSSSSAQNVTFVSSSTSSTNNVSTAYDGSTSSGNNSQKEGSSSYTDDLMYSFFANQSSAPQLDHEDLEQVDEFDLKEMDLKWQVAMISMRLKKFYKKIGRKLQFDAKEPVGFDKTKVECFNYHKIRHFARECRSKVNQEGRRRDARNTRYKSKDNRRRSGKQEESKALVTVDGDGVDWTGHPEEDSSKGLSKLLNSQMSAKDKSGFGYVNQIHEDVISYENEVLESVFVSRSSDVKDSLVNDRFAKDEGMHAVPPPMTGIYMPLKFDFGIYESNVETLESVPKPAVNEPKVVSKLKVWSDAPFIKEYESNSDDENEIKPSKE